MSDDIATPQPHFVPKYTGYTPQLQFTYGETYGTATHRLFLDPNVGHSEKLVLSPEQSVNAYQATQGGPSNRRSSNCAEDCAERQSRNPGDTLYNHPMVPGYTGYIPRQMSILGQRFTVAAEEGINKFYDSQSREKDYRRNLRDVQNIRMESGNDVPGQVFRPPLLPARPEVAGVAAPWMPRPDTPRRGPYSTPYPGEPLYSTYNNQTDKFVKQGYSGHVPFNRERFGLGNQQATNTAIRDFSAQQSRRAENEWAPVTMGRSDPPYVSQPNQIYRNSIGLLPNYTGHVPGSVFRFGNTYGNDTVDAKRWLRRYSL